VANIVVVIEVEDGRARPVCLEVLGQARRVGSTLGATVYALAPLPEAPRFDDDDLIAVLGRHGADKVVLITDESLPATSDRIRWGTHGGALAAVSELLPPSLLLFGATIGGRELAARAATRLGAAFLHEAWIEVQGDRLALWQGEGEAARSLDADLEFPVVATVPPGRYPPAAGCDEAEVEVIATPAPLSDFEELDEAEAPVALVMTAGAGAAEAAALAEAVAGRVVDPAHAVEARLALSLGPPLTGVLAEVRVALGDSRTAGAHYAVEGEAAQVARALAAALTGGGKP
jgi:electron transfer flavoprotein alpha subunit